MDGILSMVCPPGTACPLTSMGLPEILLWVLSFAVVFGVLSKLQIFGKGKSATALISIVVGFMVLMAAPAALITVISGMSTSLITLAIGVLVFIALIEFSGAKWIIQTDKGPKIAGSWHQGHGTALAAILILATIAVFWTSGGAALIGLGALPPIGTIPIVLIIVGVAVLWMLSEKPEE